jgi:HSP20 family protein
MTYYIQTSPRRMLRRWMSSDQTPEADHYLPVNVREEDDGYTLTAVVPGLKADDLNIQVLDGVVRIEGEYELDDGDYMLAELPNGKFRRTLRMPASVEADKVEAKIKDGVLTLRLPKAESALPKKIKVNVK